jgi:hypothetical protein
MSYQAFINSLPPPYEPRPGERVKLLRYDHCVTRSITHEVRQDRIGGFGIYFGSKKDCLCFIECHALNLAGKS